MRYRFSIENFCILGNHFHFILQPRGSSNLSRIMQWILSVIAVKYNKSIGSNGHVWGERFFSRVIADIRQYTVIFLYILTNPVDAGLATDPLGYEFSGVAHLRKRIYEVVEPPGPLIRDLFPEYFALF